MGILLSYDSDSIYSSLIVYRLIDEIGYLTAGDRSFVVVIFSSSSGGRGRFSIRGCWDNFDWFRLLNWLWFFFLLSFKFSCFFFLASLILGELFGFFLLLLRLLFLLCFHEDEVLLWAFFSDNFLCLLLILEEIRVAAQESVDRFEKAADGLLVLDDGHQNVVETGVVLAHFRSSFSACFTLQKKRFSIFLC